MKCFVDKPDGLRSPDISWRGEESYGHITVYGWSTHDDAIRALEVKASFALARRIANFINESAPTEDERAYMKAMDEAGGPFGRKD